MCGLSSRPATKLDSPTRPLRVWRTKSHCLKRWRSSRSAPVHLSSLRSNCAMQFPNFHRAQCLLSHFAYVFWSQNVLASDGRTYLAGNILTEIDVFAFSTLLRFDLAYYYFFRCDITNLRAGFPLLHAYLLHLLQNQVCIFFNFQRQPTPRSTCCQNTSIVFIARTCVTVT